MAKEVSLSKAQQASLVDALDHPRHTVSAYLARTGEILRRHGLAEYVPPVRGLPGEWRLTETGVELARNLRGLGPQDVTPDIPAPQHEERELDRLRKVEDRLRAFLLELESGSTPDRLQTAAVTGRIWTVLGDRAASSAPTDTAWTGWRAAILLSLSQGAGELVRQVVAGSGWIDMSDLSQDSGRTYTIRSIRLAIAHGARMNCWPSNIAEPVTPVFDSTQRKVLGYRMADDLVPIFRAALARQEPGAL